MPSSDPTFPLFSIFAFVGFVLTVIPLPWHFQAWNSGTCAFMLWVGSFCLVLFINSLIWADNALNTIPVWCDISSQILAGAGVGIPASTLCITRRLYRLTSTQTVSITRDDKMRAIYEDIAIAAGLPIFVLILHIIVQPHRFDIIEEYGCSIATYNTIPSYFLFYMWPVLLGSVSFIYSSLTLRTFYMRRIQFNQILSANTAINPSRYIRLMLLALIDIMCTIPLGIYVIYLELHGVPLQPWISWDDTHFDFGRVVLVPAVVWRSSSSSIATVQINRWLPVACAFVFFALFGFAEEAMKNYRRSFWYVAKLFGFHPRPGSQSNTVHQSKSGMFSGLKRFKLNSQDWKSHGDLAYSRSTESAISSARLAKLRQSVAEAEFRSTICFPDDDVELGPYRTSFINPEISHAIPLSPSSSTSTYAPHTPGTPTTLPPSYKDSTCNDAAASAFCGDKLDEYIDQTPRVASWVTLPDMIIADSVREHAGRPSSYSSYSPSLNRHTERTDDGHEEDEISITDAHMDSRPASPISPGRAPTPMPFASSELPVPPPPALSFHRPFSPPSVYPVTQSHLARNANASNGSINGITVTVHTQSSRESL